MIQVPTPSYFSDRKKWLCQDIYYNGFIYILYICMCVYLFNCKFVKCPCFISHICLRESVSEKRRAHSWNVGSMTFLARKGDSHILEGDNIAQMMDAATP